MPTLLNSLPTVDPIEVGFDAEHEGSGLPIVAGLAAADESGASRSEAARKLAARKPPSVAAFGSKIDA